MKITNKYDLYDALLLLKNREEAINFVKDLCTPQEIDTFQERWQVCQLLEHEDLSYRDIHKLTGASPTTIGRVARFLKTEPYQGYATILKRIRNK